MAWYTVIDDQFEVDNNPLASPWTTAGTYGGMRSLSGYARVITASGTVERRSYYNQTLTPNQRVAYKAGNGFEYPEYGVRSVTAGTPTYLAFQYPMTASKRPCYLYLENSGSTLLDGPHDSVTSMTHARLRAESTTIEHETSVEANYPNSMTVNLTATDSTLDGTATHGDQYAWIGVYDTGGIYLYSWFLIEDETAPLGQPTMTRWGGVPYMTLGRRKW